MSVTRLPIAIIAVLIIVFAISYVIADTNESAGREDGVTLNALVEDPARYEGQQVTISGEWAENDYIPPHRADEVIVVGDDAGATLVAVPQLGVAVPPVDEDTVLRITGTVRVPERRDAGYIDRGGLLQGDGEGPEPVIAAERVDVVPEPEDPAAREADAATVGQLLADPAAFDERAVVVSGSATQLGGRGFRLTQSGASIFVSAPEDELEEVQDGEQVRIRAELSRLSSYGADALEKAIASDPPGDQPPSALELEDLPIEVGEPYLLLRGVESAA